MIFDKNYFKYAQLIVAILRLIGRIFGDSDDKANDDTSETNHKHEIDHIIPSAAKKKN